MPRRSVPKVAWWNDAAILMQAVQEFASTAAATDRKCEIRSCPHCGNEPSRSHQFTLHARRSRLFLVVQGSFVVAIRTQIPRWRCLACRRTFSEYPRFALPYRRYTRPQMQRTTAAYLTHVDVDYRGTASVNRLPIFYTNNPSRASSSTTDPCYRVLAHTTIFRWVSVFGGASSLNSITVDDFEPAPKKHRSDARRIMLIRCYRVVTAESSVDK